MALQQSCCLCIYQLTTEVLRPFAILEYLRWIPPPHLYDTNPSPQNNVEFPVSRTCLFPVQHWKEGGGIGCQCKPDLKWNKWNVAISTRFSQLSQLLLSPIVPSSMKIHHRSTAERIWDPLPHVFTLSSTSSRKTRTHLHSAPVSFGAPLR